ncbi:hypothetical protein AWC38_SpisGene12168 [Stylophora pistillata]|uniref:Uncharacterized protein n=1 Tax=Stylophora pistillata TaxID=50429 RepID=A0A2B4S080_STYPI|nr:hypothetical protein AWC38_SpisGene12168 [Stylophora pistillata]
MTDSRPNQFRSLMFQPTERRKKPKALCKIKRKGVHVGWGCLVDDAPGETSNLTKYFIITSSKAIPIGNFDAKEYEVEFKKRMVKCCRLTDIAKTIHHVLSGLVLIAIYPQSYEFNHASCRRYKCCSVLKKSPKNQCLMVDDDDDDDNDNDNDSFIDNTALVLRETPYTMSTDELYILNNVI